MCVRVICRRDALDIIGKLFSVLFLVECLVKIAAMGFVLGPKTYLSQAWNYLDLFIVIIGVLDFIPSAGASSNLSSLRSLRVVRPLRAVTKFPQLQFLVVLLFRCLPQLINVLGLCSFIFFVFGILGVQMFNVRSRSFCPPPYLVPFLRPECSGALARVCMLCVCCSSLPLLVEGIIKIILNPKPNQSHFAVSESPMK